MSGEYGTRSGSGGQRTILATPRAAGKLTTGTLKLHGATLQCYNRSSAAKQLAFAHAYWYPVGQPEKTSMHLVPDTPRALALCSEVNGHLNVPLQRLSSPTFLTTSVIPMQRRRDEVNSCRHSPGRSSAKIAEQDHGQTEAASEPLSSHGDNHEPVGTAKLPRRTQPHGSASKNDSASIDGDGKTAQDGDRNSCSDCSDDSDGGNDGDDEDYNDDGSSSDSEGENGGHRNKRKTDHSPSISNFDSPPDNNIEERAASLYKRRKVALDGANMPLPGPNYMPRSAGHLSRSPERPQTATLPSPPASNCLSETESDKGSDRSTASTASFGEWLLQNAALKCVTIDGVDTYQLQFQRAPTHSCSQRRERRSHPLVKRSKGGRKPRDETKGRRCGLCKQAGHNARTCQGGMETSNEESNN